MAAGSTGVESKVVVRGVANTAAVNTGVETLTQVGPSWSCLIKEHHDMLEKPIEFASVPQLTSDIS